MIDYDDDNSAEKAPVLTSSLHEIPLCLHGCLPRYRYYDPLEMGKRGAGYESKSIKPSYRGASIIPGRKSIREATTGDNTL